MIERRAPHQGFESRPSSKGLSGNYPVSYRRVRRPIWNEAPMDNRRCAGLFPLSLWRWRLDIAALEQVIEPADPIPAIAVSLEQQVMFSVFSSSAVIVGQ